MITKADCTKPILPCLSHWWPENVWESLELCIHHTGVWLDTSVNFPDPLGSWEARGHTSFWLLAVPPRQHLGLSASSQAPGTGLLCYTLIGTGLRSPQVLETVWQVVWTKLLMEKYGRRGLQQEGTQIFLILVLPYYPINLPRSF